MIRKLILAAVAAAMLVAMAIPAFAQNINPNAIAENFLRQQNTLVCAQENNATNTIDQRNTVDQHGSLVAINNGDQTNNATLVNAQSNYCRQAAANLAEQQAEAAAGGLLGVVGGTP
jgi:hypothetical protein